MTDNALGSLRMRAQAVARLYFDVLWPAEGVPEISSAELAKFRRAAVRTGREYLAVTTGWDADQIHYDPLAKAVYSPLDPDTAPPFFPDEVRFGLRALDKEAEFWTEKLASVDHVIPHDGPGVIALDGEASLMSRYVFVPPPESFLSSFHVAESALAAPMGKTVPFTPVGYDTSVVLTDRLVYVAPVSPPAQVGRMSYSDLLAVSEERRAIRSASKSKPSGMRSDAFSTAKSSRTRAASSTSGGLAHGDALITETTIPLRDTAVYRLHRNAPFADSPAFYRFDRRGEAVHLLTAPASGSSLRRTAHRLEMAPLEPAVVSRVEAARLEETISESPTIFVATPRAVLVTRTHGPAKVRVMETSFPKPAGSEKAPPLLLATTAAITAEPLNRKVSQAVQAALAKPAAIKAFKAAAPSTALHAVAEARWRMPLTVLPKPAATGAPRAVAIGPKVFLSELRIPETAEFRALPPMRLIKPRFLQALSLGHVEVARFREEEIPAKSDLKTVGERLKETGDIARRVSKAQEQADAEDIYRIRAVGPVQRAGGFDLQRFSVIRRPQFETSLLDLKEFEFIKPPERRMEISQAAPARLSKPERKESAPRDLGITQFADQIMAAVVRAVGPAYGKSTTLPAVQSGGKPMAVSASSASSEAGRKRELEELLKPVAEFFKPVFAKPKPEAKPEVTGGAMAAPGLFDVGGGALVAVLPRETGKRRSTLSEAAERPFEPAETLRLFPTSVGWMFSAAPEKEKSFRDIASASGLVVKPVSKSEADAAESKSKRDDKWNVDEAELVSASTVKSHETEQLWRAITKEASMAESKAYASLAARAEPPVRKRKRTESEPSKPEPAKAIEVKKVSSDPLHDFDENVLDEIMFALRRRMESEAEGRGGYE